jgi:hypothetical protein
MEYQLLHMDRLFAELQRARCSRFRVTEQSNARFPDRMTTLVDDSVLTVRPTTTLSGIGHASNRP